MLNGFLSLLQLKVSALLAAVFVVFGLIVFVSLVLLDHKNRQIFVGYLSVASLIFMFASPLSIIVSSYLILTGSDGYSAYSLSLIDTIIRLDMATSSFRNFIYLSDPY